MRSQMKPFWGRRVVLALLLILAFSLTALGCASSYLQSYKLGFQGTSPRFNTGSWKIEHNLFSSTGQRMDKEDWEDD